MQTYFIFTKQNYPIKVSDNGFCFYFFFLSFFRGALMGLWTEIFINLILLFIFINISKDLTLFFLFLSNIFWGFFGKDLYIQKLLKNSYFPKKILNAPSKEKALILYLAEKTSEKNINN